MAESWIVAMGGGAFADEPNNTLLHDYIFSLSGKDDPKILFIPTATGDLPQVIQRFYTIFTPKRCRPSHLALILEPPEDLEALIMAQDIIYVSGGNTAVMLAAWRLHGLDKALEKAYAAGKVFCGGSAGAICWYEGGTTDSFTKNLTALNNGLGWVKGYFSPHYDAEPMRRPRTHSLIQAGELLECVAADEGVGFVYRGSQFVEIVSSRPKAKGWYIKRQPDGTIEETEAETRYLGA
jgi:dipeptidase E